MGSGSTGQAALNLNRKFVGFELDRDFFNKALNALYKRLGATPSMISNKF
jgi:site-specific DNA-methyltransferase (adenine-specific)